MKNSIEDIDIDNLPDPDIERVYNDDFNELANSVVLKDSLLLKRKQEKIKLKAALKSEVFEEIIKEKPIPGYYYHIVSNGKFDFFSIVPVFIKHLNNHVDLFYGSTWASNAKNVLDLMSFFDKKIIKEMTVIGGDYMKMNSRGDYGLLKNGMEYRKQRFIDFKNHCKVLLMCNHSQGDYFTVEGSSNWTSNPRVEQYVLTNNKEVFDFHKNWIDGLFTKGH